jgi:hypothetical protein
MLPSELVQFAFIPNWYDKLKILEGLIPQEKWKYVDTTLSRNTINPILENYLCHTFKRLLFERNLLPEDEKNKKIYIDAHCACINSGLLNQDNEFIFLYFDVNQNANQQPYKFRDFFAESHTFLRNNVPVLPSKVQLITNLSEVIFDTNKIIQLDVPHILTRKDRLPASIRNRTNPDLTRALYGALGITKKRVEANYKLAELQYFEDKMQFLLPLCLENNDTVSVALAIDNVGGQYLGKTCLPIEVGYNNARVIANPKSNWLT